MSVPSVRTVVAAAVYVCALACVGGTSGAKEAVVTVKDPSIAQLEEGFRNPSQDCRALPMYSVDYSDVEKYARDVKSAGWGGVNAQFLDQGEGYMRSEDAWRQFERLAKACRENDLSLWIYDERGYPSGKAGFLTLEGHPEFEAQGLFYDSKDIGASERTTVSWTLPKGRPYYVAVCALDTAKNRLKGKPIDVTRHVSDGVLKTEVGPGDWRLMAFMRDRLFAGTHADVLHERYVNIMDPKAIKRFLDVTHEQYYAHCGDEFGKTIKAFFTDEPSLMGGYLVDKVQDYPVLSWADCLPDEFRKVRGYDIREALPALFNDAGPETARIRCDYYDVSSRLTADSFFGQIRRWCEAHNVESTGHCVWEESLIYHAAFYGSIMDSLAEFDRPGIDLLGCNYGSVCGSRTEGGPVTPKLISSSAHLNGRPRTATESFCFVTKEVPLESMLSVVAWQWTLGINTLSTLSMQQAHDADTQRLLNEYTGRMTHMLTQGRFVADVAVLYPIASVWADYRPTKEPVWTFDRNPKAAAVDESWQAVTRTLLGCQRDFDYIDERSIAKAKVDGGAFTLGDCRYSILVLPNATTLSFETLRRIDEFVQGGGTVVTCGAVPCNRADRGSVDEFERLADALFAGGDRGKGRVVNVAAPEKLPEAMRKLGDEDLKVTPRGADVYYQHRSLSGGDIYFVLNNSTSETTGAFTFRATGRARIWDPRTAAMTPVESKTAHSRSTLSLTLPARNGVFVVFDR